MASRLSSFGGEERIKGLDGDDLLEVRAPSHNEMNRWLSTLNMNASTMARTHQQRGGSVHLRHRASATFARLPSGAPPGMPPDWPPEVAEPSVARRGSMPPRSMPSGEALGTMLEHGAPLALPGGGDRRMSAPANLTPRGGGSNSVGDGITLSAQGVVQLELIKGWLAIKKETGFGTKVRFCKLVGEVGDASPARPDAPGTPARTRGGGGGGGGGDRQFSRVTLYAERPPAQPPLAPSCTVPCTLLCTVPLHTACIPPWRPGCISQVHAAQGERRARPGARRLAGGGARHCRRLEAGRQAHRNPHQAGRQQHAGQPQLEGRGAGAPPL